MHHLSHQSSVSDSFLNISCKVESKTRTVNFYLSSDNPLPWDQPRTVNC